MATLILSCNTGEGHNSCAKAIKEYYDSQKEVCVIKDGLEFISPKISRFISWGHAYVYRRLPWLFKFGYGYAERHPSVFHNDSAIYKFITKGTEAIYDYVQTGHYDTVICTHVFTALMITSVINKYPVKLATCFVSTDYTCSPSTKDSNLDVYFIPDREFQSEFRCDAITDNKLISSGIPVRQMFYNTCVKTEAKSRVAVKPESKHLIMMCGSMGCGPMKKLLNRFAKLMPIDCEISVICGNNKTLYEALKKKHIKNPKIHIRGFVNDMGTMMDSADLYLTKPGGISITEAHAKSLPMVFIDAVAGCEEYNRMFFIRKGGAAIGGTTKEIVDVCISLLSDDEKRKKMRDSLSQSEKRNSAKIIYDTMKRLSENNSTE